MEELHHPAHFNRDVTDDRLAHMGASRESPPSRAGAPAQAPEISVSQPSIGLANLRMIR